MLDFGSVREGLPASQRATGRPSVDPEPMLRILHRPPFEEVARCAKVGLLAGREVAVYRSTVQARRRSDQQHGRADADA